MSWNMYQSLGFLNTTISFDVRTTDYKFPRTPYYKFPRMPYQSLLLLVLVVFGVVLSGSGVNSRIIKDVDPIKMMYEQWIAQFGRVYKDAAEKEFRFKIFKTKVEYIENFNKGNHTFTVGLNAFSDLTNEEFTATYTGLILPPSLSLNNATRRGFKYENITDVPPSLDWRTKGAVTPVKKQGRCGACWAFSTVAAVEGAIAAEDPSELIPLSTQQLVDCDTEDKGCSGGNVIHAFEYIIKNGGLTSESDYPYINGQKFRGICQKDKESHYLAGISYFEFVPRCSESHLLRAVSQQPVSASVHGNSSDFINYTGGVFKGECGTNLNHAVTVVGYGTDSEGSDYWLVKNSWGTNWGENGYMRMQRNIDAVEGLCGIAMQASYPIVD